MHNMFYSKDDNYSKVTTVNTTHPQPVEVIHMYFSLYNVTYVRGFTSMIIAVFEKTTML